MPERETEQSYPPGAGVYTLCDIPSALLNAFIALHRGTTQMLIHTFTVSPEILVFKQKPLYEHAHLIEVCRTEFL